MWKKQKIVKFYIDDKTLSRGLLSRKYILCRIHTINSIKLGNYVDVRFYNLSSRFGPKGN